METAIATKRILFIDDELHVRQIVKACHPSVSLRLALLTAYTLQ